MIHLKLNTDGTIDSSSKEPQDITVADDFFYTYNQTYWVYDVEEDELVLQDELGAPAALAAYNAAEQANVDSQEAARELKARMIVANAAFLSEVDAMTAGYSQTEIDTFPTQEAEALAFTADAEAPTPLLDALVSESGETKDDLVVSINAKAALLKVAVGKALGRKRFKLKD